MSKIQEMIERLCPGGIEFMRLRDFTQVLRGKRLTKNELTDSAPYPVFHGGIEPIGYYSEFNRPAGTVMIINVGASAGTVGYSDVPFWSSDGCFCIDKNEHVFDKYLYYFLSKEQSFFMSRVRRAGIPTLDSKDIADFEIPVPPIDVQREIVKVLDSFSDHSAELVTELKAELAARKKQYEYYHNSLLNINQFQDTVIERLGDCCQIVKGDYLTKKDSRPGLIPVILGGQKPAYFIDKANHYGKAIVISRSGASAGFVSWWNEPIYVTDGFLIEPSSKLSHRYLYYYLKNVQPELNNMKRGGGVPHISGKMLLSLDIPIPSLEDQERIVSILDKLETLNNCMAEGLTIEIKARQQQYIFYRDQLLTFKRAN